jgi:hypothetical protein
LRRVCRSDLADSRITAPTTPTPISEYFAIEPQGIEELDAPLPVIAAVAAERIFLVPATTWEVGAGASIGGTAGADSPGRT